MRYYKVLKNHCDVVENELLTEEELKKYEYNKKYLEIVEIKKSNTYKFFGIRFEMKNKKSLDRNKKAWYNINNKGHWQLHWAY